MLGKNSRANIGCLSRLRPTFTVLYVSNCIVSHAFTLKKLFGLRLLSPNPLILNFIQIEFYNNRRVCKLWIMCLLTWYLTGVTAPCAEIKMCIYSKCEQCLPNEVWPRNNCIQLLSRPAFDSLVRVSYRFSIKVKAKI